VRHPDVDKIAFTGSTRAGRRIASLAGEQLKRVSLELGGRSAAILLPDTDLTKAVAGLKFGSLLNNGESCIAQTRILAPRSRYGEVVAVLKEIPSPPPCEGAVTAVFSRRRRGTPRASIRTASRARCRTCARSERCR
jgi:acyl-CoA reductase-like NAD-dependent aldehyde dehydrogenase